MLNRLGLRCTGGAAALAALLCVAPVRADELPAEGGAPAETAPAPDPTRGGWDAFLDPVRDGEDKYGTGTQKWIEDRTNIHVGAGLVKSWLYNTNQPASSINSFHTLDSDSESANLDLFQLSFARPSQGWFIPGFGLKLDFGRIAKHIKADYNGDGTADRGQTFERNDFDAQEAYLTWTVPDQSPALKGLTVKGGKFVTLLGAEVIEPWMNPTFSHSFLFNLAIPFTHTGVLLSYPLTDKLSVTGGAVRGWDKVDSNNHGWTGIGNVTWTATDEITLSGSGIWGPEQTGKTGPKRGVADLVATIKPTDKLTFLLNYDWGHEESAGLGGGPALWQGFAGIASYTFTDRISASTRGEWFEDHGGSRTGLRQTLWETTLDGKYMITQHLAGIVEYRHDGASHSAPFEDAAGNFVKGTQDILGFAFEWVFS